MKQSTAPGGALTLASCWQQCGRGVFWCVLVCGVLHRHWSTGTDRAFLINTTSQVIEGGSANRNILGATHGQFNIFRALRCEPRGQKPPNKVYKASEWGRSDPQNKPWEDHQGVSSSKPRKTLFQVPTQTVLVGLGKRSNCLFIVQ
jgi:hypothetical protein